MKTRGPSAARLAPTESDAALLERVAAGDLASLGTLYDRHARDVWRILQRVTGGSHDVDDLVHATFLALPRVAASFDGRSSCKSWLSGIAVKLSLRRGRSVRRFAAMVSRLAASQPHARAVASDPEGDADRRREVVALDRAIARLSPKTRVVFVLVELEGLERDEVARLLDIPMATVRTRLFNGKRALRAACGRGRTS